MPLTNFYESNLFHTFLMQVMTGGSRGVDRSAQYSLQKDVGTRNDITDTSMPDSYSMSSSYTSSQTRTTQRSRQPDSRYMTPRFVPSVGYSYIYSE